MKRTIILSIIGICGCMMEGCMREQLELVYDDTFSIYATREDTKLTKTELQADNSIVWTDGDAISLFVGSGKDGGYKLTSSHTGKTSEAIFKGNNIPNEVSGTYWAVYPYNKNNTCDGYSITTNLPSKQIAKAGSFADSLFISVAKSESNVMTFYNVCGGIKFTVANDGIYEVVLTNNDGGKLYGTLDISFDKNGIPVVRSIKYGKPSISVVAPDGGTFAVGESYYAVIPPVEFSQGVTMKFLTRDGKEAEKVIPSSSAIERSVFTRLLQKDAGASFEYCPYLTFFSEGSTYLTFSYDYNLTISPLEYSYDRVTWYRYDRKFPREFTRESPLFLRGINETLYKGYISLSGDRVSCRGNIMKLLDYRKEILNVPEKCFYKLFSVLCDSLVVAPDLPATNLAPNCYESMFAGCKSLKEPPKLPAISLAKQCYGSMFAECESLETAPELPATELAANCYRKMFSGCKALINAPECLPALSLADSCYINMFENCSSLKRAPKLFATNLANYCYANMFRRCNSLTTAPELPAANLASHCYERMFWECKSLTIAPELPAATLAPNCYNSMFYGCEALLDGPKSLPALSLADSCYYEMFCLCDALTTAPELPATNLASHCYKRMFWKCKSLTIAPELPATTLAKWCYSGMFYRCESMVTAPRLPAAALAEDCYSGMFNGCESLATAPELPATTLAKNCYSGMFISCNSLTTAPELPVKNLAYGCYSSMFADCESLKIAPELPAVVLKENCYKSMFSSCNSLTSSPVLPALTLLNGCYYDMFQNCKNLHRVTALFSGCYNCTPWNALGDWLEGAGAEDGGQFRGNSKLNYTKAEIFLPDNWRILVYQPNN